MLSRVEINLHSHLNACIQFYPWYLKNMIVFSLASAQASRPLSYKHQAKETSVMSS